MDALIMSMSGRQKTGAAGRSRMAPILKADRHDEERELEFELAYLRTLSTQERFELMFRKSREMAQTLLEHGYRKPFEILKRT